MTIIKNANIIQPSECIRGDILIRDGVIQSVGADIESAGADIIDAGGLICAPGIIDMHVHMRDPGQTHKEDMDTVSRAAAAGGVTTILAMPNTSPPVSTPEAVRDILTRAAGSDIRIYQCATITKDMAGSELNDFAELKKSGATALTDDGRPVENSGLMLKALLAAKEIGLPILSHAEELSIAQGGIMNDGEISQKLGVKGIHRAAEDAATARDIAIAAATDCAIHICHVSTAGSAAIIRDAKRRGIKVTAETAPHYLCLSHESLLKRDADYRMNPPLRTAGDVGAMIEAVRDGTIDVIATDHAPHSAEEKSDFESAPFGAIGLETLLPVCYTTLVKPGIITAIELWNLLHRNPANILGLSSTGIEPGAAADMVLFDPEQEFTVDEKKLHGKSQNTPFKGMDLFGKVRMTMCRGKVVFR